MMMMIIIMMMIIERPKECPVINVREILLHFPALGQMASGKDLHLSI